MRSCRESFVGWRNVERFHSTASVDTHSSDLERPTARRAGAGAVEPASRGRDGVGRRACVGGPAALGAAYRAARVQSPWRGPALSFQRALAHLARCCSPACRRCGRPRQLRWHPGRRAAALPLRGRRHVAAAWRASRDAGRARRFHHQQRTRSAYGAPPLRRLGSRQVPGRSPPGRARVPAPGHGPGAPLDSVRWKAPPRAGTERARRVRLRPHRRCLAKGLDGTQQRPRRRRLKARLALRALCGLARRAASAMTHAAHP